VDTEIIQLKGIIKKEISESKTYSRRASMQGGAKRESVAEPSVLPARHSNVAFSK